MVETMAGLLAAMMVVKKAARSVDKKVELKVVSRVGWMATMKAGQRADLWAGY